MMLHYSWSRSVIVWWLVLLFSDHSTCTTNKCQYLNLHWGCVCCQEVESYDMIWFDTVWYSFLKDRQFLKKLFRLIGHMDDYGCVHLFVATRLSASPSGAPPPPVVALSRLLCSCCFSAFMVLQSGRQCWRRQLLREQRKSSNHQLHGVTVW